MGFLTAAYTWQRVRNPIHGQATSDVIEYGGLGHDVVCVCAMLVGCVHLNSEKGLAHKIGVYRWCAIYDYDYAAFFSLFPPKNL